MTVELPAADPEPGTVHVWLFEVERPWFEGLADRSLLTDPELRRADRFSVPELARGWQARRTALRLLLGRYLARPASDVQVVTAPGGKPVLLPRSDGGAEAPEPTLAFSVGHSGTLYGIAVARARAVGFDVEVWRSVPRADAIAERWFAAAEAARLSDLEGDTLHQEFMRLWTGKEALAKRHGAGLRLMMRGDEEELDVVGAWEARHLRSFEPRAGYTAAVASSSTIEEIVTVAPEEDPWTT